MIQRKTGALKQTYPLPVHHSWPLYERDRYFRLGQVHDGEALKDMVDFVDGREKGSLGRRRIGRWECDLSDNSLTWSNEVYDIFGIPRGEVVAREEAVALYGEDSRAAMEKLRAYAIKHWRGFTLDVEIRPVHAAPRWIRLITAPVCADDHIVRLQGLKFVVPDRG